MKRLVLAAAFALILQACSSKPVVKAPEVALALDETTSKQMEEYCGKGNPFACYRLGSHFDELKQWESASKWFRKACDLKHPSGCSEASVLAKSRLNDAKSALRLAKESCALNDTLGCYNRACYECMVESNPDAAFQSLERSVKLGYRNKKSLVTDTDLECVQKDKRWELFLKSIPDEGNFKETHRYALMTGMRHLYHPKLKFSYAVVPGFNIEYSLSGVLVQDDAGSRVYFSGSNQAYSKVVDYFKKAVLIEPKEKTVHTDEGTVNGYPAYVKVVKGLDQGMEQVAIFYVTGDENYTVTSQGTYLASYHSTYGDMILQSAESIVINPSGPPGPEDQPFRNAAMIGSYRYAGLQNGGPLWTQDNQANQSLILNPYLFTNEDPQSDATFEKLWGTVTHQSLIEVPKFNAKRIKKQKTPSGNQAWHYRAKGKQTVRDGKPNDIQIEVGLVQSRKKVELGSVGYFWARVLPGKMLMKDTDTAALSNLILKE